MARLPSQPEPVKGAAYYYAEGNDVYMVADGFTSCVQSYRSEGTALDGAKKWQEKENKAVTKEYKRLNETLHRCVMS